MLYANSDTMFSYSIKTNALISKNLRINLHEGIETPVHYLECTGTAHRGEDGTTLVFIHGLGANASIWKPCMQELVNRNASLRCLALDLPNHGASEKITQPDMFLLIEAIHQFLVALNLDQIHLVGHSFGACLLIHSDNNPLHTTRIKQYHLLSPVGIQKMSDRQKNLVKNIYDVEFLMKFGKEGSYKSFQKYFVDYEDKYDDIWGEIEPDIDRHPHHYYSSIHALANSVMDHYELKETTIFEKVQFIIGREDVVIPFKALGAKVTLEDLRDNGRNYFPNSEWQLIEHCGHYPQLEKKELVVDLIIQEL